MTNAPDNGHMPTARDGKAALRNDIEHVRRDIEERLLALENELSPGQILDRAMTGLRESRATDFTSNLGRTVSEHPLPVLLTTVGIGWLIASERSGRRSPSFDIEHERSSEQARARLSSGAEQARARGEATAEQVSETAHEQRARVGSRLQRSGESLGRAREGARESLGRARERARAGATGARDSAGRIATRAHHGVRSLGAGVGQGLQSQPLVGVLAAFGLGALFGALFPTTRAEQERLGPMRDDLFEEARRRGDDAVERGKRIVHAAVDAAAEEAGATEPRDPDDEEVRATSAGDTTQPDRGEARAREDRGREERPEHERRQRPTSGEVTRPSGQATSTAPSAGPSTLTPPSTSPTTSPPPGAGPTTTPRSGTEETRPPSPARDRSRSTSSDRTT